jgi:DNA-binding LacI/PurR family transcriptional regulator
VAGCDGLPFVQYTVPPLTTMVLDYQELGRMAVRYIFDTNRDAETICRTKLLPHITIRESTA